MHEVPATVVWDTFFTKYDFGPGHPMTPVRLDLTARLCDSLGLFESPNIELISGRIASDEELLTVHDKDYIEAVKGCSVPGGAPATSFGLGTDDDPLFENMHEASARIVGASLQCADAIMSGKTSRAVNFCGGMHHAMPGRASGFCVYNDIAVAIQRMLDKGAKHVLYVDIDVHHGDGVERIFWNEPRVTTLSIHESGVSLFPGTGYPQDIGGKDASGTAINVGLPKGSGDAQWLRTLQAIIEPVIAVIRPDVLVSQHGCDTHKFDPLGHLKVSLVAQRRAAQLMRGLADAYSQGRWLALGGGGYDAFDVVPRSWTHLVGVASEQKIPMDTPIPEAWRTHVEDMTGSPAPTVMGDGGTDQFPAWSRGYDPEDATDRAILATRKQVFPLLGLDPYYD